MTHWFLYMLACPCMARELSLPLIYPCHEMSHCNVQGEMILRDGDISKDTLSRKCTVVSSNLQIQHTAATAKSRSKLLSGSTARFTIIVSALDSYRRPTTLEDGLIFIPNSATTSTPLSPLPRRLQATIISPNPTITNQ